MQKGSLNSKFNGDSNGTQKGSMFYQRRFYSPSDSNGILEYKYQVLQTDYNKIAQMIAASNLTFIDKQTVEIKQTISVLADDIFYNLTEQIDKRKVFVMFEDLLNCDIQSDHLIPKSLLPLYQDYINQGHQKLKKVQSVLISSQITNLVETVLNNELLEKKILLDEISYISQQYFQETSLSAKQSTQFLSLQKQLIVSEQQKIQLQSNVIEKNHQKEVIGGLFVPDFEEKRKAKVPNTKNELQQLKLSLQELRAHSDKKINDLASQVQSLNLNKIQLQTQLKEALFQLNQCQNKTVVVEPSEQTQVQPINIDKDLDFKNQNKSNQLDIYQKKIRIFEEQLYNEKQKTKYLEDKLIIKDKLINMSIKANNKIKKITGSSKLGSIQINDLSASKQLKQSDYVSPEVDPLLQLQFTQLAQLNNQLQQIQQENQVLKCCEKNKVQTVDSIIKQQPQISEDLYLKFISNDCVDDTFEITDESSNIIQNNKVITNQDDSSKLQGAYSKLTIELAKVKVERDELQEKNQSLVEMIMKLKEKQTDIKLTNNGVQKQSNQKSNDNSKSPLKQIDSQIVHKQLNNKQLSQSEYPQKNNIVNDNADYQNQLQNNSLQSDLQTDLFTQSNDILILPIKQSQDSKFDKINTNELLVSSQRLTQHKEQDFDHQLPRIDKQQTTLDKQTSTDVFQSADLDSNKIVTLFSEKNQSLISKDDKISSIQSTQLKTIQQNSSDNDNEEFNFNDMFMMNEDLMKTIEQSDDENDNNTDDQIQAKLISTNQLLKNQNKYLKDQLKLLTEQYSKVTEKQFVESFTKVLSINDQEPLKQQESYFDLIVNNQTIEQIQKIEEDFDNEIIDKLDAILLDNKKLLIISEQPLSETQNQLIQIQQNNFGLQVFVNPSLTQLQDVARKYKDDILPSQSKEQIISQLKQKQVRLSQLKNSLQDFGTQQITNQLVDKYIAKTKDQLFKGNNFGSVNNLNELYKEDLEYDFQPTSTQNSTNSEYLNSISTQNQFQQQEQPQNLHPTMTDSETQSDSIAVNSQNLRLESCQVQTDTSLPDINNKFKTKNLSLKSQNNTSQLKSSNPTQFSKQTTKLNLTNSPTQSTNNLQQKPQTFKYTATQQTTGILANFVQTFLGVPAETNPQILQTLLQRNLAKMLQIHEESALQHALKVKTLENQFLNVQKAEKQILALLSCQNQSIQAGENATQSSIILHQILPKITPILQENALSQNTNFKQTKDILDYIKKAKQEIRQNMMYLKRDYTQKSEQFQVYVLSMKFSPKQVRRSVKLTVKPDGRDWNSYFRREKEFVGKKLPQLLERSFIVSSLK